MGAVVAWALATGAITGAVWIGTVLVSHLRKLAKEQLFLLAKLEDRLEFAERLLAAGPLPLGSEHS